MKENHKTAIIVLLLLLLLCAGLTFVLRQQPPAVSDKRIQSEQRVAELEAERTAIANELKTVNTRLDSAFAALKEKPKQITQIKIKYIEKRDSIIHLPVDERVRLFAKRLSEGANH